MNIEKNTPRGLPRLDNGGKIPSSLLAAGLAADNVNIEADNNPNDSHLYQTISKYIYDGSDARAISNVKAIGARTNTVKTFSLRLYDVTNAQVIAEVNGLAPTPAVGTLFDLGLVSNLPTNAAVFDFQVKVDSPGAPFTNIFVSSFKITY